jgi:(1->4)-alpha-D-glucan 1-alpha-D-glucosylmutase
VLSYMRGDQAVITVPRLVMQDQDNWQETFLEVPEGLWHDILSGEKFSGGPVMVSELLAGFPVSLLIRGE